MKLSPSRTVACSLMALIAVGCCTNRNNCPPTGAFGYSNARVPPPPTGSYSTVANQPYYSAPVGSPAPGGTTNSSGLPAGMIPAGTVSPPASGWQPATQIPGGTSFYGTVYPSVAYTAPPAAYNPGSDYMTTTIDERSDPTRMAATDATGVRAPTNIVQMSGALPSPIMVPGSLQAWNNPAFTPANPAAQNANFVVAQSSTANLAGDPNYRMGWRPVDGASQPTVAR